MTCRQPSAAHAHQEMPESSSLRARAAGVTLIELLVGTAILIGILAAAYACLQGGLRSRQLVEERADVLQNARVALNLMARDLRAACRLSSEFEFVGFKRTLDGVEAGNLDFATRNWNPRASGEGDFCEISYYLDKGPRDDDGDREANEPGLWRRRDPSPDDNPFADGIREPLIRGVRGLRFEYSDGFFWYDSWGKGPDRDFEESSHDALVYGLSGLPDAVRITLALSPPGGESSDPPLVFETVVYLHLARHLNSTGDSSWGGESGSTQSSRGGG